MPGTVLNTLSVNSLNCLKNPKGDKELRLEKFKVTCWRSPSQ